MKELILACGLSLICTSLFAQSNSTTVIVKKIEGFSESGDAFSFKSTTGKRYQVYNAGGSNPIQGEDLISSSIKSKKAILLIKRNRFCVFLPNPKPNVLCLVFDSKLQSKIQ